MAETVTFLISGLVFGLAAGISPGPLLALVISETLKHSRREGVKVAIAPILTDTPIVLVTIFILAKLASFNLILGAISISGALFISYLAYESITTKAVDMNLVEAKVTSIRKGIVTNFLSPHPYLFWMTIGAPTVLKAYSTNATAAILFIAGFYFCLVGSKIVVALVVDKSKSFLSSKAYVYIMRILGLALLVFAVFFIRDGLKLFGVI